MNLDRTGTAVDIERLGELGRSVLRPYTEKRCKSGVECGALAAEQ
jgi:hypothetical protein